MADGQVVFEITADGKKAVANIKDITKAIEAEGKKWDQSANQSTSGIENAFSGMVKKVTGYLSAAKIGKMLLDWGSDAVQLASDLQEVQNVVDTVFGSGSSKIETWAKKAGTQFGLTELQAKKFTSTLGAMVKSSGLAGDEIISMSTDLAGLAADMASFYNLDFETAFEKIRSGISGETMPLKQLGINMSVANLEAFALAQGLEKTFSEMSQGEQTMLRYQYLMQATSDAQGDFAKTADSFENAKRRITTALDSISSVVGQFILVTIDPFVSSLAKVLEKISAPKEETLFDKVSSIEMDAEAKIAEIDSVAQHAQDLIQKLEFIAGTDAGDALEAMAVGANKLDASAPSTWKAIFNSLQGIDGLQNIFTNDSAGTNIEDLANALSESEVDYTKAEAWKTFLGALAENADAVSKLTGKSVGETVEWLNQMSSAVNGIDASDADAWNSLLTTLVQGFSADTPEGKQFIEGLATQFLALGSDSDAATKGLEALGFSSEQIADKQKEWLKTCKELVQTIPGLSGVINTETGAIDGGIGALEDYYKEWQETQKKIVLWKAYYAKLGAYNENQGSLASKQVEAGGAQIALDNYLKNNDNRATRAYKRGGILALKDEGSAESKELMQFVMDAKDAQNAYNTALEQGDEEAKKLKNEYEYLKTTVGELTEEEVNGTGATEDAAEAMTLLDRAMAGDEQAAKELADQWKNAGEALKTVSDYYKEVRDATEQAVNSTVKGFEKITTEYDDLKNKQSELSQERGDSEIKYMTEVSKLRKKFGDNWMEELQTLGEESDAWKNLSDEEKAAYNALVKLENAQNEVNDALNEYSPKGMQENLQSQIEFMQNYMKNLNQLKEWGVSDELLASLSDGSKESASYLQGLVDGGKDATLSIDELYQEVQTQKKGFTDALTEQKLAVDETYSDLVEKAKEAMEGLDLGEEAQNAMGNTVIGIANGISQNVSAVSAAMTDLMNALNPLSSLGFKWGFSEGSFLLELPDIPHFAGGTDWIPGNNFPAFLDYGEAVLTAEENQIWQRFKNGQQPTSMDYDALGGVMRDNVKAGGDVYLDGRTVGQVVSNIQGTSYRNLKRSGWQS